MKNKVFTLAAFCLMCLSWNTSRAQANNNFDKDETVMLEKDTIARLMQFTGKSYEQNIYLHWDVTGQHADGIYVIYRSNDGVNYSFAGQKRGIGVPIEQNIAYYFTDKNPGIGTVYYRLLHISSDKTYLLSSTIQVSCEAAPYFSANCK